MTSPSETIAKALEGKNRVQGMVRSIDQYRNCDPKAIADGSYAQILYALTDDKHDILVLWDFAVATGYENIALALQLEAMKREMAEKDERIAALEAGIGGVMHLLDGEAWESARTLIQGEKQ